jgi:16S rRNA processing protein RimM
MPRPQQEPREGYVAAGRVLRPWGLRGHVKVEPLTDFPERFERGARLWLDGVERTVEHARSQTGYLYLKFSGIDDVADAEPYRGLLLEVAEAELPPLDQDEYYHHQLVGLRALSVDGDELGTVTEVLRTGSNAVLVVHGPRGEVLLPFIDDVVKNVDLSSGSVSIELIEGMLAEPVERPVRIPPHRHHARRRRPRSN